MENRLKTFFIILFLGVVPSYGQSSSRVGCGKIFEITGSVDSRAKYISGDGALMVDLLNDILKRVFKNCIYRMEDAPSKLLIVLVIDDAGSVIDAAFPKNDLSSSCQLLIKEKLLKMKGWQAVLYNGNTVCSKFTLPIACLRWAE